jgi:hypothetical protein
LMASSMVIFDINRSPLPERQPPATAPEGRDGKHGFKTAQSLA